jgi:hypothetical protein
MPLPKPKNKEKKSDFVSRCISEVAKDPKFKDNKQRIAICYTQFDEAKSQASIVGGVDEEEFLVFAEMKMPMDKTCAQCGGPMTTTKEGLAVCKSKATCAPKKSMSAEEPSKQEKSPMHEKNPKDPKEDLKEKSMAQQMDLNAPEMEEETPDQELLEMKKDLYNMAISSLASIKSHTDMILNSLNDLNVQENLTETWMQGKLAVAEDYVVTVHNYVMFSKED